VTADRSFADDGVLGRLRDIVAGAADLDADEVTPEALLYDDLCVDSLQKLEIVVRIERAFGVKLTDHEAVGVRRLTDALELLRVKGALSHG
jgi:acyl carrier protein